MNKEVDNHLTVWYDGSFTIDDHKPNLENHCSKSTTYKINLTEEELFDKLINKKHLTLIGKGKSVI
tara:strand:+ start:45774 stop:45971 length:198 start_codon:yes stop_codon:yes gene_type:complete